MTTQLTNVEFHLSSVPEALQNQWIDILTNDERPAMGQVATVGSDQHPSVRTVHLRFLPECNSFGFNTSVESPKWKSLRARPALAGLYYDPIHCLQMRWSGGVDLIDQNHSTHRSARERMWQLTRQDVREAYWAKYGTRQHDVADVCPGFGTVICRPSEWDVYRMNEDSYAKDSRVLYAYTDTGWSEVPVSVLDGARL